MRPIGGSPDQALARRACACAGAIALLAVIPLGFSDRVLQPGTWVMQEHGADRIAAYWSLVGATLWRVMRVASASFVVCCLVVAVLSALPRRIAGVAEAVLNGARYTPSIAWLPLTIGLVGVTQFRSQLVFVLLGTSPMVLFNLMHGLHAFNADQRMVARLSKSQFLPTFRLALAASQLAVFHALRISVGLTFILCIVFGYLFPSIRGVERMVEVLELLRYKPRDFVLFTATLMAMGVLCDQVCVGAHELAELWRDHVARRSAGALLPPPPTTTGCKGALRSG